MQTLVNNIKVVTLVPLTVDDETITGDAVDTTGFDSALLLATVGAVGADVTTATITIQEANVSDFSDATTIGGGTAVDVIAGDMNVQFQVSRTKRYIRALVTLAVDGEADTIEVVVTGVLANWALPLPIV